MRGYRVPFVALACALLALPASATADTLQAEAVLPPGQSGFVSITGLPNGEGSPHLTDQVDLFTSFRYRSLMFDQPGEEEIPRSGVRIVRDAYGVPSITAETEYDAWWGVGYAVAQDRLFQLELFKRATSGRLAEILGSSYVDDDIIARRDYYTDAEIDRMITVGPGLLRERAAAYADGINAWIDHVQANPQDLPGEFAALGVPLTDWTIQDSARVGVFLARTVPSGDGQELDNALALERLAPRDFDLLHPLRTPGARETIPASEGRFPREPGRSRDDERIGYRRSLEFIEGFDFGTAVDTAEAGAEAATGASVGAGGPGAGLRGILPSPGGSFMWAVGDREADRAWQFNGPQLGYSIPELFVEFELHSPQLPHIRGVSAPGVPLIGIGHNGRVAWGFTSGLSDEDDLYVEELTGDQTYRFRGEERQMNCRDEQFSWNTPATDLPGLIEEPSAPAGSTTVPICRTVHGPVQLTGEGFALSRRYAIWKRELETFEGIDLLNRARTIRDVDAAMRKVTWNENVLAADSRGNIGYWHPGLHQLKPLRWDERLPFPGTGDAEWRGLLPRSRTPHVINPDRGWLVNWNNVPSAGWTNGDGESRERATGPFHRVRILQKLVRGLARNPSFERSTGIVRTSGTTAQQRPFVDEERLRRAGALAGGTAEAAIEALLRWDGDYHTTDDAGTVDPGVAIWEELKAQMRRVLIAPMGPGAELVADEGTGSSHGFDISNGEATALRVLGVRAYAKAAKRTARVLETRFGTDEVSAWREPRLMYEVSAMGAGSSPDLPFFDRGTWEQSVMLGRSVGSGR